MCSETYICPGSVPVFNPQALQLSELQGFTRVMVAGAGLEPATFGL